MEFKILEDMGLTRSEATIYISLLDLGQSTSGKIIKKTGFHKATVYQTLERLQEKALVSHIIKGGVMVFMAVNPKIILEQIQQKELNFKQILPILLEKEKINKEQVKAEIFYGKQGIISVYKDILNYKEYFNLGAGIPILEVLGDFFYQFQKIKKERRIKSRILLSENMRKSKILNDIYGKYKFLPKSFEGPVNTLIYGDKIAIILWPELIVFMLSSKETNKVYRRYFDTIWKIAKR